MEDKMARQEGEIQTERVSLRDQKDQVTAKETRLVSEREKIRSERDGIHSKHRKELDTAFSTNSRNMAIVSALAFISGLMMAHYIFSA